MVRPFAVYHKVGTQPSFLTEVFLTKAEGKSVFRKFWQRKTLAEKNLRNAINETAAGPVVCRLRLIGRFALAASFQQLKNLRNMNERFP